MARRALGLAACEAPERQPFHHVPSTEGLADELARPSGRPTLNSQRGNKEAASRAARSNRRRGARLAVATAKTRQGKTCDVDAMRVAALSPAQA